MYYKPFGARIGPSRSGGPDYYLKEFFMRYDSLRRLCRNAEVLLRSCLELKTSCLEIWIPLRPFTAVRGGGQSVSDLIKGRTRPISEGWLHLGPLLGGYPSLAEDCLSYVPARKANSRLPSLWLDSPRGVFSIDSCGSWTWRLGGFGNNLPYLRQVRIIAPFYGNHVGYRTSHPVASGLWRFRDRILYLNLDVREASASDSAGRKLYLGPSYRVQSQWAQELPYLREFPLQ